MYVTSYPASSLDKAKAVYSQPVLNSMEAGLAVLYQKCPHLGCRVPPCFTSQWFECPCHGSQYNQAGEKKGGPAPRGMDRFVTDVSGGVLTVDTGIGHPGPAHRHQHHRPRSRRSSLCRRRPLMGTLAGQMVLADVQKTIGYTLAVLLIIGFAIAVALNMRKGRKEVGSEIELAANRKPYYDDDTLETRKLDRTLQLGLLTLIVIAVALPLYWLAEPGRQDDRIDGWNETFIKRGETLYNEGANCAACHGPEGTGGAADLHDHRRQRRFRLVGELAGAGPQHRAVSVLPRRGPLHPQLRPRLLADARLGCRLAVVL